jgi:hypothetical protein
MEKKAKRFLTEIFNSVPKRSLIADHFGLNFLSEGRMLVAEDNSLTFIA